MDGEHPIHSRFPAHPPVIIRQRTHDGADFGDVNWQAEMQRRRLQRLLSTSIFICFLVLFFDNKHGISSRRQSNIHRQDNYPFGNVSN